GIDAGFQIQSRFVAARVLAQGFDLELDLGLRDRRRWWPDRRMAAFSNKAKTSLALFGRRAASLSSRRKMSSSNSLEMKPGGATLLGGGGSSVRCAKAASSAGLSPNSG